MRCFLCPRNCGVDRSVGKGVCGEGEKIRIAYFGLHFFEEPPISGTRGSGAVFFSGCPLKCVYCQNGAISRNGSGREYSVGEFAELLLSLSRRGAHNINLVTPTHFSAPIAEGLKLFKSASDLPVVYNCGGYESVKALRALEGLTDVYLPDFKYYSPVLSSEYSSAPDYFEAACAAIAEMSRQQPEVVIEDGLVKRGVIIRHLVLPGCVDDSLKIIEYIAENFSGAYVSIMRQYTPEFYKGDKLNLRRKLTSYEYDKVVKRAEELGLKGFIQQKGCETSAFTPDFSSKRSDDGDGNKNIIS